MNRLRSRRLERGETLIGVLIALSIGLIVVGMCLSAVAVATRARMKLDATIERAETERLRLERASACAAGDAKACARR